MDDDRRSRISRFFAWYRQRVANIRALGQIPPPVTLDPSVATFGVEQHVLIGAGLDSLANHWARAFPHPLASKCVFRADPGARSDGTRGLIPR